MSSLKIENISKYYKKPAGAKQKVLENINLSIETSERREKFVSILASFSSGKTTLLKIISALEKADSGKIILQNETYSKPTGKIAYIPEKPSSLPWMNVEENIRFAASNNDADVKELIDLVGLNGYEDHHPHNDSQGFQFRISLARALAVNPDCILLDDPFKRMDSVTKDEIYEVLRKSQDKYNAAFILATTNVSEAIYLSDKIYLMSKGPGKIIEEIKLDIESLNKKGLNKKERFNSLRNEIEKSFLESGETFQTEI